MAKAMQVGLPQSLQLVFGVSLKMSRPFNAIVGAPPYMSAATSRAMVLMDSGCLRMTASLP